MIPAWAGRYVGLAFRDHGRDREGVDCWGLLSLVMREQYGVELPSYADRYASAKEREEIAALLLVGVDTEGWYPVSALRAGLSALSPTEQESHLEGRATASAIISSKTASSASRAAASMKLLAWSS